MAMIVVLSPKGGAGKTTVATNLAVRLAQRDPGGVALLDLDVAFGDVATALLLDGRRNVLDVLAGGDLDHALVTHPSGLRVLLAPDAEIPDPAGVGPDVPGLLDAVAERFGTVVVDTGAGVDPVTLAAVGRATHLVLVGAMDVATLLDLRKVLRLLDRAGAGAARHLVLNRADDALGLDVADAEGAIGLPVDIVVPLDSAVARTVNEGLPVEDGEAGRAFDELAERLAGSRPPSPLGWMLDRLQR